MRQSTHVKSGDGKIAGYDYFRLPKHENQFVISVSAAWDGEILS